MITQLSHKPWMRLLAALMAAHAAAIPTPLTLPVGTAVFLMTSDEFEKHSFPAGFYTYCWTECVLILEKTCFGSEGLFRIFKKSLKVAKLSRYCP